MFAKLWVIDISKLSEFAAVALWDLGFDLLELYKALVALARAAMALALVA